MGKIARDFKHLQKILIPSGGAARMRVPEEVVESITPVIEALGSSRLDELRFTALAAGATAIDLGVVPEKTLRLVKHADAFHGDVVPLTRLLGFHYDYKALAANRTNVEDDRSVIADQRIGLETPILIRAGDSFGVHSSDGPPALLSAKFIFVDLDPGEVIPHLIQK